MGTLGSDGEGSLDELCLDPFLSTLTLPVRAVHQACGEGLWTLLLGVNRL